MYSSRADDFANQTGASAEAERILGEHTQLRIIAKVCGEAGRVDFAIAAPSGESLIVRCVETARDEDECALMTMIAQGPFSRGLLVAPTVSTRLVGSVSTCCLSELSEAIEHIVSGQTAWT
jgi:hypothetical protein